MCSCRALRARRGSASSTSGQHCGSSGERHQPQTMWVRAEASELGASRCLNGGRMGCQPSTRGAAQRYVPAAGGTSRQSAVVPVAVLHLWVSARVAPVGERRCLTWRTRAGPTRPEVLPTRQARHLVVRSDAVLSTTGPSQGCVICACALLHGGHRKVTVPSLCCLAVTAQL